MEPFRLYRKLELGEFILVGADCAQGGEDSNFACFMSKTKLDIPLVYQKQDVAEEMTVDLHPVLEWIYNITLIPPVVAFERNMGGASEMTRLQKLNRSGHYIIYLMKKFGTTEGNSNTTKLGWETTDASRP